MSGAWPDPVERVAAFLRETGAEARLEEFKAGTPTAEAAAEAAIELARAWGSQIVVLCAAVPEAQMQSVEGAMSYDPGLRIDELLAHARGYVDAVATRAQQAGVACTAATCTAPDAAEAIVEAALRHGCDLILMGSHGRRGLSRLLAGSVTQAVLGRATVPVMVLRPAPGAPGMSHA